MSGTYAIDFGGTNSAAFGSGTTVAEVVQVNTTCVMNSLSLKFASTGVFNGKVVVYDNSGTLIGSSAVQSLTVSNVSLYYDVPLSTPLTLTAATTYKIGYWGGTGAQPGVSANSSTASIASSPAGVTMSFQNGTSLVYTSPSTDSNPTTSIAYRISAILYVDIPTTPTGVTVTNTPVTNGTIPTVSWTATGQSSYRMRWKKTADSTWNYDVPITSSSSTNMPLYTSYSQDFESGLDNWGSTTAFGAYVAATSVVRTTAKADTGTYSLVVTLPTTTSTPTWANTFISSESTAVYEVTARVWVPTGVPPLELNSVFWTTSTYRTTTNNAWETIRATFVGSGTGTSFVGIQTTGPTTAGQVFYIDNVTIKQYELDGGSYEVQVQNGTSGTWSSSANFVVNTPPTATAVDVNPKYVGGNVNVTWTYNDVNSNAQTKYQIRRRQRT